MTLLDALRLAEQQGKRTVHRGAEKLHAMEDAVRRKIGTRDPSQPPACSDPEPERESLNAPQARTGIVSVNGRDVEQMRCTGGRRTV